MHRVSGRVVVRESGTGVPNLLVTVLADVAEGLGGRTAPLGPGSKANRIAAIITDDHGRFSVEFDEASLRKSAEDDDLDLVVVVSTPDMRNGGQRLYVSEPRQRAGRVEEFLIELEREQLAKAAIKTPRSSITVEEPELLTARLATMATKRDTLSDGVRGVMTARVERSRATRPAIDEDLAVIRAELARPAAAAGGRVTAGQSVKDATRAQISAGTQRHFNQQPIKRKLQLSAQALQSLREGGGLPAAIPRETAEHLLRGPSSTDGTTELVARDLVDVSCQHEALPLDCGPHSTDGDGDGGATPPSPTNGVPVLAAGEIVIHGLQQLMRTVYAPNGASRARPDTASIQEDVDKFALRGGPADAPSFHDFHHLQIAFDAVWQDVEDERTVTQVRELLGQLSGLGIRSRAGAATTLLEGVKLDVATALNALNSEPDVEVISEFEITLELWRALTTVQQNELREIAKKLNGDIDVEIDLPWGDVNVSMSAKERGRLRRRGELIVQYAHTKVVAGGHDYAKLHQMLAELEARLKEPYAFSVYAANGGDHSVNFAILVNYRQKWEPLAYQVGELVRTIPLAPKESRKFTRKLTVKQSRSEKEVTSSLRSRRSESTDTSRADTEIVREAQLKTNFSLTASGGFQAAIWNGSASTTLSREAAATSRDVKRDFREAVVKSADEYKNERSLQVELVDSVEAQTEETGEISNPNDEIPVTYLFYELQRRFRVSEHIHRVSPVVLIAQDVPRPDQIDADWLVAHDWILRRVLLDDSFIPALTQLSTRHVGDEFALAELKKTVEQQRRIVDKIEEDVTVLREQVGRRYAALERSIETRADAVGTEANESWFESAVEFFAGEDATNPEAARVREEAARDAHERAARDERDVRARLEREVTALNAATETYTRALTEHLNRVAQIARLRVHVKQNILYYMQAIWSHEPPDQRYFRLHKVQVPIIEGTLRYQVSEDPAGPPGPPEWSTPPVDLTIESELSVSSTADLADVAHLDQMLGFKGNYMLFPLKRPNVLTEFMTAPYADATTVIRDPDDEGQWTIDSFKHYVCCLKEKLSAQDFEALRPALDARYQRILTSPRRASDEVIVPSGSLYIEALPGRHAILEEFKLKHREVDVTKVEAEVLGIHLENLRMAARLLAGEREDPTIEKRVIIEGADDLIVAPGDS